MEIMVFWLSLKILMQISLLGEAEKPDLTDHILRLSIIDVKYLFLENNETCREENGIKAE